MIHPECAVGYSGFYEKSQDTNRLSTRRVVSKLFLEHTAMLPSECYYQ